MHYPANFNSNELKDLSLELHIYIDNVWADAVFAQLDTISELGSPWWNRIGDGFMNDYVNSSVEQEFFYAIPNDDHI